MIVQELVNLIGFRLDKRSLTDAQQQANATASAMRGSFLQMFGAIGIGAGMYKLASETIQATAQMESLKASFESMLGSGAKANQMLGQMTEFATKTPFTLAQLGDNARMLMGMGVEAEKVMPTLQMLGDIAGADGQKFSQLSYAYAQVMSTGRLMGQDLMQLINAGFNPLKIISQQTGKSMGDLKKAMEKGKISAEMVSEAFRIATSKGGMFYQNMEKQSRTLTGLWSTLKDNFTAVLRDFGNAISPVLKSVMDEVIKFSGGSLQTLSVSVARMAEPIGKMFGTLARLVLTFASVLIGDVNPVLGATAMSLEGMANAFSQWVTDNAASIITFMQGVAGAAKFMVSLSVVSVQTIATIIGWLKPLYDNVELVIGALALMAGPALLLSLKTLASNIWFNIQYFRLWIAEEWLAVKSSTALTGSVTRATLALIANTRAAWANATGMKAIGASATAAVGGVRALIASMGLLNVSIAAVMSLAWAWSQYKKTMDEVEEARKRDIYMANEQEIANLRLSLAQGRNRLKELEAAGKGNDWEAQQLRRINGEQEAAMAALEKRRADLSGDTKDKMTKDMEDMLKGVTDAMNKAQQQIDQSTKTTNVTAGGITVNASGLEGLDATTGKKMGEQIAAAFSIELRKVLVATA